MSKFGFFRLEGRLNRTLGLGTRSAGVLFLGGSLALTACVVWKDDYDVMAAKYRNETAAHEAAKADLAKRSEEVMALQAKVSRLEQSLADSRQQLDQNAESLAQAEYQYGIVEQQKQSATELVEQLRAEQERLATHLKAYASDRAELNAERERLSQQLTSAERRVVALAEAQKRAEHRLALVRDLSSRLKPEVDRKEAALLFDGDLVVVRLEASKVFQKSAVSETGKRLLKATGQALLASEASLGEAHPSQLVLSHWEKGKRLADATARLTNLSKLLTAEGIKGERFASENALAEYKANARALSKPLSSPAPVASASADGQSTEPPVVEKPTVMPDPPALKVNGDAVLIHLVPG